jgi:hypothetical protein
MNFYLRALGEFQHYLGSERLQVELPDGAPLQDLLAAVDRRWGEQLPSRLWNREQKRPESSVMVLFNGKAAGRLDSPLVDGQEVILIKMGVGG